MQGVETTIEAIVHIDTFRERYSKLVAGEWYNHTWQVIDRNAGNALYRHAPARTSLCDANVMMGEFCAAIEACITQDISKQHPWRFYVISRCQRTALQRARAFEQQVDTDGAWLWSRSVIDWDDDAVQSGWHAVTVTFVAAYEARLRGLSFDAGLFLLGNFDTVAPNVFKVFLPMMQQKDVYVRWVNLDGVLSEHDATIYAALNASPDAYEAIMRLKPTLATHAAPQ